MMIKARRLPLYLFTMTTFDLLDLWILLGGEKRPFVQWYARARHRVVKTSTVLHSFTCRKSFDLLTSSLFYQTYRIAASYDEILSNGDMQTYLPRDHLAPNPRAGHRCIQTPVSRARLQHHVLVQWEDAPHEAGPFPKCDQVREPGRDPSPAGDRLRQRG